MPDRDLALIPRAGVSLKVIQERLGHADFSITAHTYAHATPAMHADAARIAAAIDA